MNKALLTRLIKSIDVNSNTPIVKIAYSIIEDEKKKGHGILASKLFKIINEFISQNAKYKAAMVLTSYI
jgi:hypothetical protein